MIDVGDNIAKVLSHVERLSSQLQFAVAKALSDTARQAAVELPAVAERELDRPNAYTKRGFYWVRATKNNLTSIVGIKRQQAEYLKYQIYGGDRPPRRKALKLPGEIELDASGNIRRSDLRRLIAEAKQARRAAAGPGFGKTSYRGKSKGIFYGQPKYRPELPPGIYRRVETPESRLIVPLVLFPERSARYKPIFNAERAVRESAKRNFPGNLRRAFNLARSTAR